MAEQAVINLSNLVSQTSCILSLQCLETMCFYNLSQHKMCCFMFPKHDHLCMQCSHMQCGQAVHICSHVQNTSYSMELVTGSHVHPHPSSHATMTADSPLLPFWFKQSLSSLLQARTDFMEMSSVSSDKDSFDPSLTASIAAWSTTVCPLAAPAEAVRQAPPGNPVLFKCYDSAKESC